MSVQIKPCTDDDGCVSWCDESEAAYFGVYLGEQGAYVWLRPRTGIERRPLGLPSTDTSGFGSTLMQHLSRS